MEKNNSNYLVEIQLYLYLKKVLKKSKKPRQLIGFLILKEVFRFYLYGLVYKFVSLLFFLNRHFFIIPIHKHIEIVKLKNKYVPIVIDIISIALPVCIKAVPAKTKTISG